jgi:hypothetical protein
MKYHWIWEAVCIPHHTLRQVHVKIEPDVPDENPLRASRFFFAKPSSVLGRKYPAQESNNEQA